MMEHFNLILIEFGYHNWGFWKMAVCVLFPSQGWADISYIVSSHKKVYCCIYHRQTSEKFHLYHQSLNNYPKL